MIRFPRLFLLITLFFIIFGCSGGGEGDSDGSTPPITPQTQPTCTIEPAGEINLLAGQTMDFTAMVNDPDGLVMGYQWDFGNGAPAAQVQNPTDVVFRTPGKYTVTLTLLGKDGKSLDNVGTAAVTILTPTPRGIDPTIGFMQHFLDKNGDGALDADALTRLAAINDPPFIDVDANGGVQLVLTLNADLSGASEAELIAMGIDIELRNTSRSIQVRVPLNQINNLSTLSFIETVSLPAYPVYGAGSIMTQGDTILGSDILRNTYGLDGSGVKIGVLSDGIGALADSQASGDLPENIRFRSFRSDGNIAAGSEGTAMLEIIHDIAPGAELYFCNEGNAFGYAGAVKFMAAEDDPSTDAVEGFDVDIIIDDLGFLNIGPYDGTSFVSQAASNAVVMDGKRYFTVSHNFSKKHFAFTFQDDDINGFHNFRTSTMAGASAEDFVFALGANSSLKVYIQWDDPVYNNADSDFQPILYRYNESTHTFNQLCAGGSIDNEDFFVTVTYRAQLPDLPVYQNMPRTRYPGEDIVITNKTNKPQYFSLRLAKFGGPNEARNFDLFFYPAAWLEQYTPQGSVPNIGDAPNVISIGGMTWYAPDEKASYSGYGPTKDGRQKPELMAPTEVCVTGAGGFGYDPSKFDQVTCDGNVFTGTSASSPHAAAVAALLLQADPSLSNDDIKTILQDTADDILEPGVDPQSGWGRINAANALERVLQNLTLESIDITSDSAPLTAAGTTLQLNVEGSYSSGIQLNLTSPQTGTIYMSTDTTVATVSAAGLISAVADGMSTITATNRGHSDSITITVAISASALLESIEVTNVDFTLTASGATRQLNVLGHYSDGSTQDVTSPASGTTYVSSNPAAATVSADGLVTAVTNGRAVITATNSSYTDTVAVDVAIGSATDLASITITDNSLLFTEIGRTQQIQVIGHFADGSQADVTASTSGTTYQSSHSDVATVSTEGLVTAVAPGATTITATNDGQEDGIVTVVAVPAKSLVLLGEADTTDNAQSLAIYGDYAYVCGSQHITIIDISDPMQPVVQGTFGENAYTYSKCNIIGNHLVVSFNWTMVNVYTLENPLAPELVGVEDTGYCNVSGAFTRGNNLFVNTIIAGWNSSYDIVLVRGDVVAFDLIDPTTPVQADILYDTYQSFHPEWPGSNYMVGRGQALSDEVALIPTTTGATAATNGTGKVVVVDISDATNLTPLTDVEIPGTKVLTGIGSWEDHSLAVGSTGAFDFVDRFMLTGNLVLTSLDVSTPDNPLVIRTRNTDFQANMNIQVTAGINQCYAMSNTLLDPQWMAAVVDARDPVNPESITLPVALPLADIRLSDQLMYAVDIEGLKIFDLSGIVFTPHTCSVFTEYAPALDAEVHVVAGQSHSSLTYSPGGDASTDVSFELHVNGTHVADIREVLPAESARVVPLPDNLITVGENIIELINPECTAGYGSCDDGLVSWGGSACLTDREADPILWFERNEAPLDISAEFQAQDQTHTFFIRPGPRTCTQVLCDVYLNGQLVAADYVMPTESDSEPISIDPVTGANTIELRQPRCTPGEGCCPADGNITSWAGTLNILGE